MGKVAILTDSNSGISREIADNLGISVIPMPFTIGGNDYFEGINLEQSEFYEKLSSDITVMTSQPSPDVVMKTWDELLKTNDEVVYIPMSSGLSGSCQTAIMLAEDYDGKVEVVNNQRISVTQRASVVDAIRLAKSGMNAAQINKALTDDKFNSSIYIMLDTLYYLKKGGRITPAAAALGTLLKIKPVLTIQGEKLDAFAKARTVNQAKTMMINAIRNDLETRFGGVDPELCEIYVAHSDSENEAKQFAAEIEDALPGFKIKYIDPLSLSVACHIGPGALAIACVKKMDI
ncbi:MAG: DegV family protein [Lachnospiraceae bacterium]|nr:DegV family protein [Candidatus Colinaster equi]